MGGESTPKNIFEVHNAVAAIGDAQIPPGDKKRKTIVDFRK